LIEYLALDYIAQCGTEVILIKNILFWGLTLSKWSTQPASQQVVFGGFLKLTVTVPYKCNI